MNRKILVTGSSGLIAGYLIPELDSTGAKVVGFDLAPPPESIASLGIYYRGDLSDPRDLYRLVLIERPTHIIHLASILAGPCEDNPGRGYAINFGSTLTLLDAGNAAGHAGRRLGMHRDVLHYTPVVARLPAEALFQPHPPGG